MAVHETTTPSGIRVTFEDGLPDPETGKSKRRSYTVNGERLSSVTTILDVLDKPGLRYAAEKLAVAGAIQLAESGELPMHVDGALSRMKSRELRFWQVWSSKSKRGTVTHEDLIRLASGEELADLDSFPAEQRGFIRGISAWYADYRPALIDSELMVASLEHGYAGRLDVRCNIHGRPDELDPGLAFLLDLKTTEHLPRYKDETVKAPYPEHLLQVGAYEIAACESGYGATDFQAVLRVDSSGAYDFWVTLVEPQAFLAVLKAYQALKGLPSKRHEVEAVAA